jgi:hypothetical protein
MAALDEYRDFCGRVAFRVASAFPLLLLLLNNLLVVRPMLRPRDRDWNTSMVAYSLALDGALLAVGLGFIALRRWAALLASAASVYVAFTLLPWSKGTLPVLIFILITPLLTVVFWRTLVWGIGRRDSLLALAVVLTDALIHCVAFW